jgi:flap endonuclease-1
MGVQFKELVTARQIDTKALAGKTLIVDSSMWLYQFLSSIRAPDGSLFTDSKGRVTSHLLGLSTRVPNLIQKGIKLAFCFDGQPPELKYHEQKRRKKVKMQAELKYQEAVKKEDLAEMKKYAARTSRLTSDMVEDAKKLIRALGLPVIQAPSEAEAQAAYIVKQDKAYAIASHDYDSLLFGAPRVIRNLSIAGKKKKAQIIQPELISLAETLNSLGIDQDQLIALAMLIGTDYNIGGISGIGPKTALKLVKEHKGDFDELFKKVKWDSFFDCPWTEVFYLIKKMPTTNDYDLEWKKPNKDKLSDLLVNEHNFSEERVSSMMEKLEKETKNRAQKGLSSWLK